MVYTCTAGKEVLTFAKLMSGECSRLDRSLADSYLTLKVLVATIDAQWEGMGDVGSARYEPALLPPCPTIRALSCRRP